MRAEPQRVVAILSEVFHSAKCLCSSTWNARARESMHFMVGANEGDMSGGIGSGCPGVSENHLQVGNWWDERWSSSVREAQIRQIIPKFVNTRSREHENNWELCACGRDAFSRVKTRSVNRGANLIWRSQTTTFRHASRWRGPFMTYPRHSASYERKASETSNSDFLLVAFLVGVLFLYLAWRYVLLVPLGPSSGGNQWLGQLCPTKIAYWAKNYVTILTRAAHWMTYFDFSKLNLA